MPPATPRTSTADPADPDRTGSSARPAHGEKDPEPDRPVAPALPTGTASRTRNTVIFGVATGLSRVAGLAREVVASALYGTGISASAFTIAFQVPNLLRSLFADMALSAAFVPVFTDLLEQKKRREALLLASSLFWVLLIGLGGLIAVAELTAPLYMPLFVGDELHAADALTVGLARVMLPTVLLLGINGLLVGVLNAYDHFTIPAISPLVWNGVIITLNLALLPLFEGQNQIYAQAIGVLVGTVVQLTMAVPVLRRYGIRLVPKVAWRDPQVHRVLVLMVPVAISLGLINFSALVDASLGSRISDAAPRQIEAAFRLYMLPQGIFSVAIVTVLFPALSRAVARGDHDGLRGLLTSGMAQILLLLVPVGVLFLNPEISRSIIGTIFQHGRWDDASTAGAAVALVWFGPNLPLNGVSLLLSRTFFALQRPWANTGLSFASLVVNVGASFALYRPLGIAGIVLGTLVGNLALVAAQLWLLRRLTGRPLRLLPVVRTLVSVAIASVLAILIASLIAALGALAGDGLGGSVRFLVTGLFLVLAVVAGLMTYVGTMHELGVDELDRAGARFARAVARGRGLLARVPGVRAAAATTRRPGVAGVLGAARRLLEVVSLPLRLVVGLMEALARRLTGLVDRFGGPDPGDTTGARVPPVHETPHGVGGDAGSPFGTAEDAAIGRQAEVDLEGGPYDAAQDWPDAARRGGEGTLDVSWPGAPGARPPDGGGGVGDEDPRADARRLVAAREAALERMAERDRARREREARRRRRH